MKSAVVTGAAGFAGFSLAEYLMNRGYRVVCPMRPGSPHNSRLEELKKQNEIKGGQGELFLLSLDMQEILQLGEYLRLQDIDMSGCLFFHLSWRGERDNSEEQYGNIPSALDAVKTASAIGASKIILTGSQAEYGAGAGGTENPDGSFAPVTEDCPPSPLNSYGAAKAAAMILTRDLARHLSIGWNWIRIFSLYGKYEHPHTLLSYLRKSLKNKEIPSLSSCTQTWDYLEAEDAAAGILAVGERGKDGEIYNLANGAYRPLREFVEIIRQETDPGAEIDFAPEDPDHPGLSLRPSMEKIKLHTGWEPLKDFH